MTITIHDNDLDALRTILREQIGGDAELLAEIDAGLADEDMRTDAESRITLCESMAEQVGGLVTDAALSKWLTDGSEAA